MLIQIKIIKKLFIYSKLLFLIGIITKEVVICVTDTAVILDVEARKQGKICKLYLNLVKC